ncbi:MAG: hypothetical protein WAU68_10825 [Vitreimonas sp.]
MRKPAIVVSARIIWLEFRGLFVTADRLLILAEAQKRVSAVEVCVGAIRLKRQNSVIRLHGALELAELLKCDAVIEVKSCVVRSESYGSSEELYCFGVISGLSVHDAEEMYCVDVARLQLQNCLVEPSRLIELAALVKVRCLLEFRLRLSGEYTHARSLVVAIFRRHVRAFTEKQYDFGLTTMQVAQPP